MELLQYMEKNKNTHKENQKTIPRSKSQRQSGKNKSAKEDTNECRDDTVERRRTSFPEVFKVIALRLTCHWKWVPQTYSPLSTMIEVIIIIVPTNVSRENCCGEKGMSVVKRGKEERGRSDLAVVVARGDEEEEDRGTGRRRPGNQEDTAWNPKGGNARRSNEQKGLSDDDKHGKKVSVRNEVGYV
ncbi:hypothetical protein WN51_06523 [Melipona quadrifasciata]|uniref:Uncharacterized protein n=1 Tax=Melipona quadrifasciata TaxID=166423 RepID=A0A0N0U3K2_9HYME|nr:hypothetical protein WN51_06523 [Melipona quadrifasciata]